MYVYLYIYIKYHKVKIHFCLKHFDLSLLSTVKIYNFFYILQVYYSKNCCYLDYVSSYVIKICAFPIPHARGQKNRIVADKTNL